jgi:hypothetical protein
LPDHHKRRPDLREDFMKHTKPRDKSPGTWLAVTILLVFAVGAAFWVPLYARVQPKLGAFPFFYWYQLILVPIVALASWLSYLLLRTRPPTATPSALAPPAGHSRDGREEAR